MNTRQKLTLGIAAIFMVTLTVIGVTYAYFVTRINYTSGTATAVINTAKIGTNYQDNNQNVIVDNVLPGEVVYKTFVVNNESEVPVGFAVTIASKRNDATTGTCSLKDGETEITTKEACEAFGPEGGKGVWTSDKLPAFVHSTLAMDLANRSGDQVDTCYKSTAYTGATAFPDNCYNATTYDNILVELYRIENYTDGVLNFINDSVTAPATGAPTYDETKAVDLQKTPSLFEETWETCGYYTSETATTDHPAGTVDYTTCTGTGVKKIPVTTNAQYQAIQLEAPYCDSSASVCSETGIHQQNSTVLEQVAAGENQSNYYVLKVTYRNINVNQNIENDASVSLKVNINANTIPSVTQNAALPTGE